MMPEKDFKRRSSRLYKACQGRQANRKVICIKKLLESIVALMDFYFVPYKAVTLRLRETEIVSDRIVDELLGFEKSDAGKNIIDEIIKQQGITRLRTPDRKTQYSVQLENIHAIVKDTSITKYMSENELKQKQSRWMKSKTERIQGPGKLIIFQILIYGILRDKFFDGSD